MSSLMPICRKSRWMVGAQRSAEPLERSSDDGLPIHRHRHRLAHFQVAGQNHVVKVEVQCLEAALYGRNDERIVLEVLKRLVIPDIHKYAAGIEGACLILLETEVITIDDGENDLVQVGQPFAGAVVPGVTYHGVVVARHALTHHEGTAHNLGVQVLGRLHDGLRSHTAEMMYWQRGKFAIHPQ